MIGSLDVFITLMMKYDEITRTIDPIDLIISDIFMWIILHESDFWGEKYHILGCVYLQSGLQ